jgi:hypothetical protein
MFIHSSRALDAPRAQAQLKPIRRPKVPVAKEW